MLYVALLLLPLLNITQLKYSRYFPIKKKKKQPTKQNFFYADEEKSIEKNVRVLVTERGMYLMPCF